mmetsp:Transcript_31117/g.50123  ORF Transcript_31117/g.50123 Transcript_31117/m.50123 type:complete len:205 (+) Transcript_31117:389-1003(+)
MRKHKDRSPECLPDTLPSDCLCSMWDSSDLEEIWSLNPMSPGQEWTPPSKLACSERPDLSGLPGCGSWNPRALAAFQTFELQDFGILGILGVLGRLRRGLGDLRPNLPIDLLQPLLHDAGSLLHIRRFARSNDDLGCALVDQGGYTRLFFQLPLPLRHLHEFFHDLPGDDHILGDLHQRRPLACEKQLRGGEGSHGILLPCWIQ